MKVIGYTRCSTGEQADSGAGLAAQRRAIQGEAERRGWTVEWIEDVASGKSLRRKGIQHALDLLGTGAAEALVASKLDRISRSVLDFARLVEQAKAEGWQIVLVEGGFDMTTPHGRAMATVMAAFAELERELIGERTKAALRERRAEGVQLGRPRSVASETVARIRALADGGLGNSEIARQLGAEGVPAPRSATWHRATVRRLLATG